MLELACPEDREAINRILKQGHALHVVWRPDIYKMDEDLYLEEYIQEDIREKQIYVARLHGEIVGFTLLRIMDWDGPGNVARKVMEVNSFFVEESCRNQGIGTMMMTDVEALAKAFGCTDLHLSVQPENDAALHLYRKFGFTIRNINMQRKV